MIMLLFLMGYNIYNFTYIVFQNQSWVEDC